MGRNIDRENRRKKCELMKELIAEITGVRHKRKGLN